MRYRHKENSNIVNHQVYYSTLKMCTRAHGKYLKAKSVAMTVFGRVYTDKIKEDERPQRQS